MEISKVLKNYRLTGQTVEEFSIVKISDDPDVFTGVPICEVIYGKKYKDPVAMPGKNGIASIIEKTDLLVELSKLKLYLLKVKEDGSLEEVTEKEANYRIRLPRNEDISSLIYKDGCIYKREIIEQKEIVEEEAKNNTSNIKKE